MVVVGGRGGFQTTLTCPLLAEWNHQNRRALLDITFFNLVETSLVSTSLCNSGAVHVCLGTKRHRAFYGSCNCVRPSSGFQDPEISRFLLSWTKKSENMVLYHNI